MRREQPRGLLIVADPGPDPDDVKALLASAIVHKQRQLQLCGVIANGGGQPVRRARLARCILDRLHEPHIPVGIGSAGVPSAEQPHEMLLAGYSEVDDARLLDGRALFRSVLRAARPQSLVIVLISSLRDFADVVAEEPELVLRATAEVVIQGGLTPDPTTPHGYRPDASQNNVFDPDAARSVYDFCFGARLKMAVVSREAVPLLPMQLAKSFALRTRSPLLVYLANAQFLGLAGLWGKVCAGSLPARCSKQWYFATFCGVTAVDFEARSLGDLDEAADIGAHLQGFVKPYDVCALMMALPFAVARPAGSAVTVGGVQHSLLLSAEQQIDVWNVHNLLRDVYHVVATLDPPSRAEPDASGWGASSRGSPKGGSGILRRARVSIEQLTRGGSTSSTSASANSVSVNGCSGPVANPHLACLTTQLAVSAGQSASLGQQRGASGALVSMGRLSSRASVATNVGAGTCASGGLCGRASGAPPRRTGRVAPVSRHDHARPDDGVYAFADDGARASASDVSAGGRLVGVLPRRSAAATSNSVGHRASYPESHGRAIIEHDDTLWRANALGARELRVLAAEREGSAEHVLEPERIAALLELALRLAQSRQRRLEVVTLTVGGGLVGVGVAALLSISLRSDLRAANVIARVGVFWLGRLAFAAFSIVVGGTIALLSLQPLASQRKRIHALVALFNVYVIVLCSFILSELVNNMHTLAKGTTMRYDPLATCVVIGQAYTVVVGLALVAVTAVDHWRWRHELERVLGLIYRMLWVCFSGQAFAELTLMASLARVGFFAQPCGAALAVLAFLPVAVYLVGTGLTCAPSFRERMRAALMVRLGALGALEALAPFAGFGTDAIERGVSAMCAEALCDFQPVLLDERALRVLDDVWTRAAHDARGTCTPSAGAASPSSWLSRASGAATGHHLLRRAVDMARLERSDTQRADAYIVHAWADDPAGKLRVLRAYARAFAREHGRPPAVWVDALCVQARAASRAPRRLRALAGRPAAVAPMGVPAPSCAPTPSIGAGDERGHMPAASRSASGTARDGPSVADKALSLTLPPTADASMRSDDGGVVEAQTQQLEHVVLRVARSSRLLVLAGPSVFERLWCVVECYVWLATGGSVEQIALLPTTNDAADDANLLAAADTFHVLFCDAAVEVHKRRLSLVVQIATVMRINSIMRSLLDPLHAALDAAARARQAAGTAGAAELPT